MTQWFRGTIEGFFMGQPDRAGSIGSAAYGYGYRLLVYRAAIRDVELLEWAPTGSEPNSAPPDRQEVSAPSGSEQYTSNVAKTKPESSELVAGPTKAESTETPSDQPGVELLVSSRLKSEIVTNDEKANLDTKPPPLDLPPWLPSPGTAFFQPTITDARLFPVRHTAGWYEGPVHQVFIEDFRATHSKQSGKRLYGRFVGKVQAYFAMPEAPRPVAAEHILQAFQQVPEDEHPPEVSSVPRAELTLGDTLQTRLELVSNPNNELQPSTFGARKATPLAAAPAPNASPSQTLEPGPTGSRPSSTTSERRVPFLILVLLVAAALLLTCGGGRSMLWLFFLLPTLLVRRILRDTIPNTTLVAGLSALLSLAQIWLAGMVFVGWWQSQCHDMHALPLVGTLAGLAVACIVPSDIPFLVNMSSLAAMLFGWCTTRGEECQNVGRESVRVYEVNIQLVENVERLYGKAYHPKESERGGASHFHARVSGEQTSYEQLEAHRS